jgi:group I intron endonuclease
MKNLEELPLLIIIKININMKNNNTKNILNKTNNANSNNVELIPSITYTNADIDKSRIYEENRGKSGIYRWNNLITGKSYVGSSIYLSNRFSIYYSLTSLKRKLNKGSSAIYSAILKYGYSNFSLDILEYCESNVLISREQYYIDLYKPKYNILKVAGNKLGFKDSEATKAQMSISHRGINHPFFGKSLSYEWRKNVGKGLKSAIRLNITPKVVSCATRLKMSRKTIGVNVKVFDRTYNLVHEFPTITSAAKHFDISNRTIGRILDKDVPYNNFYYKSNVKDNRVWVYSSKHKLLKILDSIKKTSEYCNTSTNTVNSYVKSGKLYKNEFYFYNVNSVLNPYFKYNTG